MKTLPTIAALALLSTTLTAQLTVPSASPRVKVQQTVGLTEVSLDFSRPGVKDRVIFGDLVPYGELWRTGANAATTIGFDRDVKLDGQDVPAGSYSLFTIPERDAWTIILNRNAALQGTTGYDEADDLLRIEAPVRKLDTAWESLTIDFRGFHANGAELFIRWADVEVAVPIFTDTDSVVLAQIDAHVKNATGEVTAAAYWDAARFYVEREIDLRLAATWVEKAVEQRPEAFWMAYYRADLARKMEDIDTAVAWATKARDLAASAQQDYGYLERSNTLLDELKAARGQP